MGFGIGLSFLAVGRGELFTENFLVPTPGLGLVTLNRLTQGKVGAGHRASA